MGIDFGNLIVRELAEFRLAAMDSEPVAYTEKHEISNMHATGLYLRAWPADRARNAVEGYTIPLYRHAQPVPVVPNEIKHRIGGLDWGWEGEFNRGWNACRAAMLAAAPQPQSAQQNIPEIIPGWIPVSERMPDCWCRTCRPVAINDMRFVVCPDFGNKRCPRANDHRNACTGSNETGQEGSAYPAAPQEVKGE